MNDRLPPHSLEAEQALLGCILIDAKIALPMAVASLVGDEFFDGRHKAVYECMLQLANESAPITPITVGEKLKGRKEQHAAGWLVFLSSLPEHASSAYDAQHFVDILSEKAALRRLITVCTKVVSEAYAPTANTELIAQAEQAILTVQRTRRAKSEGINALVAQASETIETLHRNQGAIGGISTGFIDLDRAHDGLHSDELVILGGFPGSGKTSFAINIAEHLAIDQNIPVGVFSFEMSPLQLTLRMIASQAKLNLRRLRADGFLEERDIPKITSAGLKMARAPIHLEKASGMTIPQVRSRARQMKSEFGVRFWLIDYTQIVAESGDKGSNREREVANISRNLKDMAGEFGDPVIALSQLNDDGKLRESRAIGQDADSVWKLSAAKEQGKDPDILSVSLHIEKQRNGPSPMTVPLTFLKCFTRFESAAKIEREDYPARVPYKS